MKPSKLGRPSHQGASALIITLTLLVLISVLALGFFTATQMEIAASRLHLSGIKAGLYAQYGEDVGAARLRTGVSGNHAWLSQPGQLLMSATGTMHPVTNAIELHSGFANQSASADEAADLNPALSQNATNRTLAQPSAFAGTNTAMRVRWIYVRKDGTIDVNSPPAYNAANPVDGRFAFWMDDNASRLNINTAWTRAAANTNSTSHPSRVALTGLFSTNDAGDIETFRQDHGFFNSPADIQRMGGTVADSAAQGKFSITHYSHAPNLNMFGDKRIMLTTQKSLAGSNEFLDILTADNLDPGDIANVDYAKADAVLKKIVRALDRDDWPFYPGERFTEKFSSPHKDWAWQIAANILEYVRSKESAREVVDPIRYRQFTTARLASDTSTDRIANNSGDYYIGTARAPLITEMGVWFSRNAYTVAPNNGRFAVQYVFELYLPIGAGEVNLENDCKLFLQMVNGDGSFPYPVGANFPAIVFNIPIRRGPAPGTPDDTTAYLDTTDPVLRAGNYCKVTYRPTVLGPSAANGFTNFARPTKLAFRAMLLRLVGSNRIWLSTAPMYLSGTPDAAFISYNVDPVPVTGEVPINSITSVATVDPFVGKSFRDWKQGANTFGVANPDPGDTFTGPQQDADASGNVFTNGARMPARKGSAENPYGMVESVAELGWIHTGATSFPATDVGVPWRTLRLQPQKSSATDFPDWAVLDLFCAPTRISTSQANILRPNGGSLAGLINLNSAIEPFRNETNSLSLSRKQPMNSLFAGAKQGTNILTENQISTLTENIQHKNLAAVAGNAGKTYGTGVSTNSFFTAAQIAEIAGISDTGEESESLLRDVVDLATSRSSVYSIFSIGQAVSQTPDGRIQVLAERSTERVVEITGSGEIRVVFGKKRTR